MTTDKRKQQFRNAARKNREHKKALGLERKELWIKPEMWQKVVEFIKKISG